MADHQPPTVHRHGHGQHDQRRTGRVWLQGQGSLAPGAG